MSSGSMGMTTNTGVVLQMSDEEKAGHLESLRHHPGFKVLEDEFDEAVKVLERKIFDRKKHSLEERDILTAAREEVKRSFTPLHLAGTGINRFTRNRSKGG